MGFSCSICSGSLDKPAYQDPNAPPPPPQLAGLSTAPCGHLFHSLCIKKWLEGTMATSDKCPNCRKVIPQRRVLPLFPDSYDESLCDDGPAGSMECNHGSELASLKAKMQCLKEELKLKDRLYVVECESTRSLNQALLTERSRSDTFHLKAKQYESYKDHFKKHTDRITELERQVSKYKVIENALKGMKHEVAAELKEKRGSDQQEEMRTLIEVKLVLQRELELSKKKVDDERKEKEDVRVELLRMRSSYKSLESRYLEQKKVNDNLMSGTATCTPSQSPHLSVRNLNVHDKKDRKIKIFKPLGSTLVLDQDEEIDQDVGTLQMNGLRKKLAKTRKRTKPFTVIETDDESEGLNPIVVGPSSSKASRACVSKKVISAPAPPKSKLKLNKTVDLVSDDDNESEMNQGPVPKIVVKSNIPGVAPITPKSRRTRM